MLSLAELGVVAAMAEIETSRARCIVNWHTSRIKLDVEGRRSHLQSLIAELAHRALHCIPQCRRRCPLLSPLPPQLTDRCHVRHSASTSTTAPTVKRSCSGGLEAATWWTLGVDEVKLLGWSPFAEEDFRCAGDTEVAAFDHDNWSIW